MIGKVVRGQRVGGLLRYLFGPGEHNEHTNCHLAAAWDPPGALEPLTAATGGRETQPLTALLEQPLLAAPKVAAKPVCHCVLRAAPDDRRLSDAEWDEVTSHVLDRTGLAPKGDDGGCRWVAVRHAEDHVHLVVTLARQDGRAVSTSNDYYRLGQACREVEERFHLTRTAARDRTAPRRPSRGEQEKAQRAGRPEPPRATLQLHASLAAASSSTAEEFFADLARSGVLFRKRFSTFDPDVVTGYAIALPGDHTAEGEPVWFSGGKLAADLTWPALQARWAACATARHREAPVPAARPRAAAFPVTGQRQLACGIALRAVTDGEAVVRRLTTGPTDSSDNSDVAPATGDLLVGLARMVEGRRGGPVTGAAATYDRAGREPWGRPGRTTAPGAGLRSAARLLARTGRSRRGHVGDARDLLVATAGLIEAIAVLRSAQGRPVQAAAARDAAAALRHAAGRVTPPRSGRVPSARYPRSPAPVVAAPTSTPSGSTT